MVKLPPDTLPVAVISPAVPKLPTLALPVIFAVPAMLAPVAVNTALAVALPATKTETLALAVRVTFELPFCSKPLLIVVMLPVVMIAVAVPKLPTLALPVAFSVPAMLAPVPVTTSMFALPTALIVTLPFADGMFTFELPFTTDPEVATLRLATWVIDVTCSGGVPLATFEMKRVAVVTPVAFKLPTLALPFRVSNFVELL